MSKSTVRLEKMATRKKYHNSRSSAKACEIFFEHFNEYSKYGLYSSILSEVDTDHLVDMLYNNGKEVHFPKVIDDRMIFCKCLPGELSAGYCSILEPIDSVPVTPEIIAVPGVAFDMAGNRIGYGKGYYDKYLSENSNVLKVGIAYECQIADNISNDIHDVKMDFLVTDLRVYSF